MRYRRLDGGEHAAAFFIGLIVMLVVGLIVTMIVALFQTFGMYAMLMIFGGLMGLFLCYVVGCLIFNWMDSQ